MSRAFVKESDFPDEPHFAPPTLLPPGAKNYITAAGARRLRAQLDHLLNEVRPPLTGSHQDTDVKLELQRLDRQIRALEQSLRSAEIVLPPKQDTDSVRFGATVTVSDGKGEPSTYRIVGVDEMVLSRNWISWVSPLARALLSATKGQRVQFNSPAGPRTLEIMDVQYRENN